MRQGKMCEGIQYSAIGTLRKVFNMQNKIKHKTENVVKETQSEIKKEYPL